MPRLIDLSGKRFGRLVVRHRAAPLCGNPKVPWWLCACDCGAEKVVRGYLLRYGHTASCGCFHRDMVTTHGHTRSRSLLGASREYNSWAKMLNRCNDPCNDSYRLYGGRGITVCDRWRSFENFLADMGRRPPKTSLDRIDVNGNYELSNCRWATKSEQANNRRISRLITFDGKSLTHAQWERLRGFHVGIIGSRIRLGWSVEAAILTPMDDRGGTMPKPYEAQANSSSSLSAVAENAALHRRPVIPSRNRTSNIRIEINGEEKVLGEWVEIYRAKYSVVHDRIRSLGWDPLRALTTPVRPMKVNKKPSRCEATVQREYPGK